MASTYKTFSNNDLATTRTLLHEVIHIGYDMFGLGSDDDMPSVNNEYLTLITGNMLRLFTNLNPELFEYIFERPK